MKSISLAQQTALEASTARVVAFVEVAWVSGTERYCTAGASIAWNGNTWSAVGNLVEFGDVDETEEVVSTGVSMTLSAVPTARLSQALSEHIQGRAVRIWIAPMDEAYALIGTPALEWEGRCDVLIHDMAEDGTASLTLTTESRMVALLGAATRRYTDEDQKSRYPGDDFFRFIGAMNERLIVFPSAQALGRR
jgi:hypothetical protein